MAKQKTPSTSKKALGGLNFNTKVSTKVRTDLGGTNIGEVSKLFKKETSETAPEPTVKKEADLSAPVKEPAVTTPVATEPAPSAKSSRKTTEKKSSKATSSEPLPEGLADVNPSLPIHLDVNLFLDVQAVLLAPKYKRKKYATLAQVMRDWVEKNKKEIPADKFASYREDATDEYLLRISTKRAKAGD